MGITVHRVRIQPHLAQHRSHRLAMVTAIATAVDLKTLGDNLHHRHARAQAAKRILKYDLHITAQWAHLPPVDGIDILTQKGNFIF